MNHSNSIFILLVTALFAVGCSAEKTGGENADLKDSETPSGDDDNDNGSPPEDAATDDDDIITPQDANSDDDDDGGQPEDIGGKDASDDDDSTQPEDAGETDLLGDDDDIEDGGAGEEDTGLSDAGDDDAMIVDTGVSDSGDDDDTSDAGTDAGADAGDPGKYIIPPVVSCSPSAGACETAETVNKIFASYRKDYYYPSSVHNEKIDEPKDGGRFHIAAISAVTGKVTKVLLNGEDVNSLLVEPKMEWYHVWPEDVVAGEPVWFAFHSRDSHWDKNSTGNIVIQTTEGDAVNGSFPVAKTPVPLTYVTTTDDLTSFVIHVKNTDKVQHKLTSLIVNGRDVMKAGIACIPKKTIEPSESVMLTVPLCEPATPGERWTVVVEYAAANAAVGVGRVIKPFFPIEAWPNTSDCPFPGGNQENFERHMNAAIDTYFFYWGSSHGCGYDVSKLVNEVAPTIDDFYIFLADDFLKQPNPETLLTNIEGVAGFFVGDESDSKMYDNGVPVPSIKAEYARRLWRMHPTLPVYNGAMTNRRIGSFAGMVDIQGIDFYAAACAPHITQWGVHPPLTGPYDYLVNARNNHMPLPTWLYAQGLSPVWNKDAFIGGGKIHVQPDPQEIYVQAYSVIAAGGKGIMWFQSNMGEAKYKPERWEAISKTNWTFKALRKHLREGDITGMVSGSADTLVEMVRAQDALIIPVINLKTTSAPTDTSCGAALVSEAMVPHWVMDNNAASVQVKVPEDFAVADMFEIADMKINNVQMSGALNGRTASFSNIQLNNSIPVRILVLAKTPEVRTEIANILAKKK